MTTAHPDPKPTPRIRDSRAGIAKLRREGRCRACGQSYGFVNPLDYPLSRHHLVGRDLRGDDVDANLIPLCGDGTTGCHGIYENREPGWLEVAGAIRESLRPEELEYVLRVKGVDWLARYLPERRAA